MNTRDAAGFPIAAGILFGLGLGGFFDGIVLHHDPAMASYADRRGLSRHERRELEDQHLLGWPFPRDYVRLRRDGADSSVAGVPSQARPMVDQAARRDVPDRLWSVQPGRRDRRPSPARHPPCQRDSAARAVDLLGRRLPALGCCDVDRRVGPAQARTAWDRKESRSRTYSACSPLITFGDLP